MRDIVGGGSVTALPEAAHCIHIEAERLSADTEYFYQFEAMGELSPIGRTHTLPSTGSALSRYEMAIVSCQDYSAGYFSAYRDIVARRPDLIIHLGDYIYETGGGTIRPYPLSEAFSPGGLSSALRPVSPGPGPAVGPRPISLAVDLG